MQAVYTMENGVKLTTFLWTDLREGNIWREVIEVQRIRHNKPGKPFKKKIFKDAHDVYFVWDGKKVYINDYDYMPVSEMVKYIDEQRVQRGGWFEDKLFATMTRDTENFGIIFELPVYEMVMPAIGIAFTGDKEVKALCVPTEKHYPRASWGYKFTIETENKDYRKSISSRDMYFSDFASMVLSGHVDIVVKDEFIEEQKRIAAYKPSFTEKIKNLFCKKEEKEIIYC